MRERHEPRAEPLRILHVTAPARVGGLETVIQALVPAQLELGDPVAVAAVVVPGDDAARLLFEPLRPTSARLEALELPVRAYVREGRALARLARDHGADVVHTHGYRSDVVGGVVGRLLGLPRVSTVHGFIGGTRRGRTYERLQRLALGRFEAVVAVSRALEDDLLDAGVSPGRLHVVPNAWSPAAAPLPRPEARAGLGIEEEGFHVVWLGRLSEEKAPDLAVRALAAMDDPSVILHLVGEGPSEAETRALAASLGVADRVRFHGLVDGAGRYLAAFDAFLLSSRTEGTPMALFEAMAAGVPVVATAVGGVPDVVEGAAVLVGAGDPAALARGLREVRADPEATGERARRARERLRTDYDPRSWAERYRAVYLSALGRGPAAPPDPRS